MRVFEHFERALARGHGVLFATAHLGNWELSAFAHGLMAAPMHVVARPLDNPVIDALVEARRELSGNRVILKHDSARPHPAGSAPQSGGGHPHRSEFRARWRGCSSDCFRAPRLRHRRPGAPGRPQRCRRHPRLCPLEPGRRPLRPALLSARRHHRRCRRRYPGAAEVPGSRHPPVPRPVALDPPPLEDAPARRAAHGP